MRIKTLVANKNYTNLFSIFRGTEIEGKAFGFALT